MRNPAGRCGGGSFTRQRRGHGGAFTVKGFGVPTTAALLGWLSGRLAIPLQHPPPIFHLEPMWRGGLVFLPRQRRGSQTLNLLYVAWMSYHFSIVGGRGRQ